MMAALNSDGPRCGTSSFVLAERAPGASSSSRFGSSANARTSASTVRFDGLPPTNATAGVFCRMSAALIAAAVSGSFALGEGKGGCMFLPTSDRRFLMKTVKEDEKEKLLHILEDYYSALVYQLRALYALCVRSVLLCAVRVSVCG